VLGRGHAVCLRRNIRLHRLFEIVLVAPQIASNTGSIIRLCANVGARLHLVGPLGFTLDDAALRRGGLDYHELADVQRWDTWAECRAAIGPDRRWFLTTARAERRYDAVAFEPGDVFVFGREADGLPASVLDAVSPDHHLMIPMRPHNRSINLANAVSIVIYEAWRQHDFEGGGAQSTFEEQRAARPPD
jgi:tRNA (cytidine/uridine-2'-O-)-methyltransferase